MKSLRQRTVSALPIAASAAAVLFCVTLAAQTTQQPAAVTAPAAKVVVPLPAPAPAVTNAPRYIFQTQSPLVVVDVVALDSKGNAIHGLKQTDFSVTEKGQPMVLKSFEEHRSDQQPPQAKIPQLHLGPDLFTNYAPMPSKGPLNILLLDALNTQQENQVYVRQQMLEYIRKLPPGTHMAIFALTDHLILLQGFTTDPDLLRAVLNNKTAMKQLGSLNPTQSEAKFDSDYYDLKAQLLSENDDPDAAVMLENLLQFQADVVTAQTTARIADTLAAMNVLARYLSGLPGRKNLLWFSGSFPLSIMPDSSMQGGQITGEPGVPATNDEFSPAANFADDIKATADLLARSQVAVYPVDARGIFTDPQNTVQNEDPTGLLNRPTPGQIQNPAITRSQKFFESTDEDHSTLDLMAQQTGGKAFYKTNDLVAAARDAIYDGSNYYTLTYVPDDRSWDGIYRKVGVKVDRPHTDLFYRHGYYAMDPQKTEHGQKTLPVSPMQMAMFSGAPNATQIVFTANVEPSPTTEDTILPTNKPSNKGMKAPYRRYVVRYADDPRNLSIGKGDDGTYHAWIELAAVLYDNQGHAVNEANSRVRMALSPENYRRVQQQGLHLNQEIDVPAKGDYFLRIGMHDLFNDSVGSINIPLSQVKILPNQLPIPGIPSASAKPTPTPAPPNH